MKLSFAKLLLLTLIQGEIAVIFSMPNHDDGISAEVSSSEDDVPDPVKAVLPTPDYNNLDGEKKRILRKRAVGRIVEIPMADVERMADVPVSALSCDLPNIQQIILDAHNKYRSEVKPTAANMLKLVWNAQAAEKAQFWAKQCQNGHSPTSLRQIPELKCGENVFQCAYKVSWEAVIGSWYSEKVDFVYGLGAVVKNEIGHFTQLMWATSGFMGCGMAECPNGKDKYIYVCHYCPAGNKGSRASPWKNGETCGDCPNSCDKNLCTNHCPYQNNYGNCRDFMKTCPSDPTMPSKCPAACKCVKGEIY